MSFTCPETCPVMVKLNAQIAQTADILGHAATRPARLEEGAMDARMRLIEEQHRFETGQSSGTLLPAWELLDGMWSEEGIRRDIESSGKTQMWAEDRLAQLERHKYSVLVGCGRLAHMGARIATSLGKPSCGSTARIAAVQIRHIRNKK